MSCRSSSSRHTSGSPLRGAGSNCRKLLRMLSLTSMMAAMFPASQTAQTSQHCCLRVWHKQKNSHMATSGLTYVYTASSWTSQPIATMDHAVCGACGLALSGLHALATAGAHTAAVAVVGRREDGDHILVVRPVVALHHQLVRARDQVQAVRGIELLADILPKGVPCASGGDAPATPVIWVRPAHRLVGLGLQICTQGLHTVRIPCSRETTDQYGRCSVCGK